MKKYAYFILIAILMASITLAAGLPNLKIKGTIEAIDATAMTITVNSTIIQVVTDFTSIVEYTEDGCVEISFEDLEIGDRVNVQARYFDGVLTAKTIIVH